MFCTTALPKVTKLANVRAVTVIHLLLFPYLVIVLNHIVMFLNAIHHLFDSFQFFTKCVCLSTQRWNKIIVYQMCETGGVKRAGLGAESCAELLVWSPAQPISGILST